MACPSWNDCGVIDGGCCSEGLGDGRPSLGFCKLVCPKNAERETWPVIVLTVSAPARPIDPVPLEEWPRWAQRLKRRKMAGERGVGDTLARKFGSAGEKFKRAMARIGIKCGCEQRQEWLNARYPY